MALDPAALLHRRLLLILRACDPREVAAAEERAALEARITQLDEERFIGGAFDGPGGVERYSALLGQLQAALVALPSAELVAAAPTLAPGENVLLGHTAHV